MLLVNVVTRKPSAATSEGDAEHDLIFGPSYSSGTVFSSLRSPAATHSGTGCNFKLTEKSVSKAVTHSLNLPLTSYKVISGAEQSPTGL